MALGLGTVGPFALPLVWFNPRYTLRAKITLTVLILALTVAIVYALVWLCIQMAGLIRQLTTMY